jgi:hypothetical protein
MYLAGVSVRRVEDITEALWGTRVSPSTVLNRGCGLAAITRSVNIRPSIDYRLSRCLAAHNISARKMVAAAFSCKAARLSGVLRAAVRFPAAHRDVQASFRHRSRVATAAPVQVAGSPTAQTRLPATPLCTPAASPIAPPSRRGLCLWRL